jgi:hypothetical protein
MSSIGGVIVPADMMSPGDLVDYVRRLEALGYDSVWIPDMFGREIYVTCGYLLDHTTSIKVASGIDAGATQIQLGVNNPAGPRSGPPWDLLEAMAPGA